MQAAMNLVKAHSNSQPDVLAAIVCDAEGPRHALSAFPIETDASAKHWLLALTQCNEHQVRMDVSNFINSQLNAEDVGNSTNSTNSQPNAGD